MSTARESFMNSKLQNTEVQPLRVKMNQADFQRIVLALVPLMQDLREECARVPNEQFSDTVMAVVSTAVVVLRFAEIAGRHLSPQQVLRQMQLLDRTALAEEVVH